MGQTVLIVLLLAAVIFGMRALATRRRAGSAEGAAAAELGRLCESWKRDGGRPEDLGDWERALSVLEQSPSEYNRVNEELRFLPTFTDYLEKFYPEDPRLPQLRQYAYHQKDTVWGIPIRRE